ncbi:MAG: sensor histidine kinase [Candidatus Polarisedimenticolia bacterium]
MNVAGIWGIVVARRGALEQAEKLYHMETAEKARTLESTLASTRADLAFLAASPALVSLERDLHSEDPREARWRRLAVEGALLLFLRGHPDTHSLVVRGAAGTPLVAAGRRGGVPVLWLPSSLPTAEGDLDPLMPVRGRVDIAGIGTPGAPRLDVALDAAALLRAVRGRENALETCSLSDHQGRRLDPAGEGRAAREKRAMALSSAAVRTEGWSAEAPWTLACARPAAAALGFMEPVAVRHRTTIVLILAIMALAVVLGSFAIQQERRGQMLEARAREEARVRELERQLFHAERLGTVGRLAAGMAHEINNPLEGISNYLRLAREDMARGDAAAAGRRLDGVQEGLDRAAGIVRQVLAHADPASSPRERVDLNAVISQSMTFVRSRPDFSRIEFVLDLAPSLPAVRGDAVTLGQLFLNLILNACEAQPGGGQVRVTTRSLHDEVVAEVADAGPGVPTEFRERVFEPFFTTKESTGLGLSICHAIARRHGAALSVGDRPGGGALFRLELKTAGETSTAAVLETRRA